MVVQINNSIGEVVDAELHVARHPRSASSHKAETRTRASSARFHHNNKSNNNSIIGLELASLVAVRRGRRLLRDAATPPADLTDINLVRKLIPCFLHCDVSTSPH